MSFCQLRRLRAEVARFANDGSDAFFEWQEIRLHGDQSIRRRRGVLPAVQRAHDLHTIGRFDRSSEIACFLFADEDLDVGPNPILLVDDSKPKSGKRALIGAERLTKNGEPGISLWWPAVLPLPGRSASRVRYTGGLPPGLVRGQTVPPSIGSTQAVSRSRGCGTTANPMSSISFGIASPTRVQCSFGRYSR